MTMTVSSVSVLPKKNNTGKNESIGKTAGTIIGAGSSIAYNVKNHDANFGWAIEEHVKNGKGPQARAIAATVVATIILGATALGRLAGGFAGKLVDNHNKN